MKIIAVIQARLGSSRLPGKVMLKFCEKPVLQHVVNRVSTVEMLDKVIVATTKEKEDIKIKEWCDKNNVSVYQGSSNDVLDRYYKTACLFNAENIIRITADCPVIDPKVLEKIIKMHISNKADYTANTLTNTYPDGQDVEILSFSALKKAWEQAKLTSEREHVTPYIRKHADIFNIISVTNDINLGSKRWTLDNKEDYDFLNLLYDNLYKKNKFFGMHDILQFLEQNLEIEKINQHIKRNEGYEKSLREDTIIK
ncbi:cytidylyltransferase domain-containing protein [bacterium]